MKHTPQSTQPPSF